MRTRVTMKALENSTDEGILLILVSDRRTELSSYNPLAGRLRAIEDRLNRTVQAQARLRSLGLVPETPAGVAHDKAIDQGDDEAARRLAVYPLLLEACQLAESCKGIVGSPAWLKLRAALQEATGEFLPEPDWEVAADENSTEDDSDPERTHECTIDAYAHRVTCRFWDSPVDLTDEDREVLDEQAEERVQHCIAQGYRSGELHGTVERDRSPAFPEQHYLRGWWEIDC